MLGDPMHCKSTSKMISGLLALGLLLRGVPSALAEEPSEQGTRDYWVSPPDEAKPLQAAPGDMDGDGVSDEIERATGTEALDADTDRDGVPDGVEDADQDGVLEPGESDPRVPGLFPSGYPHIPEPMVFDLVRGLGASAGEVEVNSLAYYALRRGDLQLRWAPEVEWAIADGVAVELELPMRDRELDALKGAFQVTLPSPIADFTHGLQTIAEHRFDGRQTELSLLYIAGLRIQRWILLGMAGARAATPMSERDHYEVLLNPSIYRDLLENVTVGLEGNLAIGLNGTTYAAAIPQVHWQISTRVRIQAGAGIAHQARTTFPVIAARLVLE